eukprot:scaffold201003_cov22-Tisochrysis_lutea.AAC.1
MTGCEGVAGGLVGPPPALRGVAGSLGLDAAGVVRSVPVLAGLQRASACRQNDDDWQQARWSGERQ